MATAQKKDNDGLDGIDFFYDDEDIWNSLFNDRDDAVLKMLKVENTEESEFELYYMCVDTLSLPAFFEFSQAFGLEPSTSLATNFNSVASIFVKLNLAFKVHGAFTVGWPFNDNGLNISPGIY